MRRLNHLVGHRWFGDRAGRAMAGAEHHTQVLKTFATQARKCMRTDSGGYSPDLLHALAQPRVEVDAKEIRIKDSKSKLLRTIVAASSAKTAGFGVPSFVPKWRPSVDETDNYVFAGAL